jgi:hypothetical protein
MMIFECTGSNFALATASSGIAALLLDGGRTAHSMFKIPIELSETSTCSISKTSELAELLRRTKLLVWDEAPMMHKFAFEAVDRTIRDIMEVDQPFGGMTVLLGGDFRQCLPVIPRAFRASVVSSCLNRSTLWRFFRVLKLTINKRVLEETKENVGAKREFSEFLLAVGNGRAGVAGEVVLPAAMLSNNLVDDIFPNLEHNYQSAECLPS